jgi:hypothetical protein
VRPADGTIDRFETFSEDKVTRFVEFANPRFDAKLGDEDLHYSVPIYYRVLPQNNKYAFTALVALMVLVLGFAFWYWRCTRAMYLVDISDARRRWFRRLFWIGGIGGVVLVLLAAASWGGSGHPPAIVFVGLFAIFCALGWVLAAAFVLTSYPAQWMARRQRTYPDTQAQ